MSSYEQFLQSFLTKKPMTQPYNVNGLLTQLKVLSQFCPERKELRLEGWFTSDQLRQIADAVDQEHARLV